MGETRVKIGDLKPEMNGVSLVARVVSVEPSRTINTRSGLRTITEAVVGDETGKVKLTMWGKALTSKLREGDSIEIRNAWTTVFKGVVQLNVGGEENIRVGSEAALPKPEEIPERYPQAPEGYRPERRGGQRRFQKTRRPYRREKPTDFGDE
ncbi:MAG: OB-fold nucleic acid binding domain-containing protein [Thermoprotei archaeon]